LIHTVTVDISLIIIGVEICWISFNAATFLFYDKCQTECVHNILDQIYNQKKLKHFLACVLKCLFYELNSIHVRNTTEWRQNCAVVKHV